MNKEQEIFLKDNWFKVSIIIAILVLSWVLYKGFVVNNYSVIQQKQLNNTDTLKLSMQCKEDGEKKLQEDKDTAVREKYTSGITNCYYIEPSYLFSQYLNTCLYSGGYTCDLDGLIKEGFLKGQHAKRWERHIVDIYSNKTLASVYVENSSNVPDWQQKLITDFWDESKKLGF